MVWLAFWLVWAPVALAGTTVAEDRLWVALGFDDLIVILRDEGMQQSADMESGFVPEGAGTGWPAVLERIYAPAHMKATLRGAFAGQLSGAEAEAGAAFFETPLGRRIVALELSARRAYGDPEIEADSKRAAAGLIGGASRRAKLLRRFITVNELIDANVNSALNASVAFYTGLETGGAFPDGLNRDAMLREVWSRRDEILQETEIWLFSYLGLAYGPLDDAELERYITFSESDAGQQLNQALFNGFDAMFSDISRRMGEELGRLRSARKI